jgi:hypothetical protein
MTELAAQLLESPKAPQIIRQVQAILNDEQTRRRAFYERMDEDMKSDRRSVGPPMRPNLSMAKSWCIHRRWKNIMLPFCVLVCF